MSKDELQYIETEGGPFILLPMELKTDWKGSGNSDDDEDEDAEDDDNDDEEEEGDGENDSDYDRANEFLSKVGVLEVGEGTALVLGEAEVTAYRATDDGGVFIQRVFGDDDAAVIAAVDDAVQRGKWKSSKLTFDVEGKGKLALFDSAYAYEDADEDEVLKVTLSRGTYEIETARVKKGDIEVGLVRLRQS